MKTILFTLFLGLITIPAFSQSVALEWAVQAGGTEGDFGGAITTDNNGHVLVAGLFSSVANFDAGSGSATLTSLGGEDAYIQKLDANGNLLWVKQIGGSMLEQVISLATDASGNVYASGGFQGTVDFDPGSGVTNLTSAGDFDIFIQKLDPNGNLLWVHHLGDTAQDGMISVITDAAGDVYSTGVFGGTVDFDPGVGVANLTSAGELDIFIHKLDASGNFLWAKRMGGPSIDGGIKLLMDANNDLFLAGLYEGVADLDPGSGTVNSTVYGSVDFFVQKLDNNGNLMWTREMGGSSDDYVRSIALDPQNNLLITGTFFDTVDFDPGAGVNQFTSLGAYDYFVQKLDGNGNLMWVHQIGGSERDDAVGIGTDGAGSVYVGGYFEGTVDFDPGTGVTAFTSAGEQDLFIQKFDANGQVLWSRQMGGTMDDELFAMTATHSGTIYTAGLFRGTADFDPSPGSSMLTSAGQSDAFVQKLRFCSPTSGTDVVTSCEPYTWIDGITYALSNNSATYSLASVSGCDSIVTLDLTVNTVDTSTSLSELTMTSNAVGATYQWIDCDSSNTPIDGATNASYTATENGLYAVVVSQNGCTDTSSCISISSVGISDPLLADQLTVYPNPARDFVHIDFGSIGVIDLQLHNVYGQLITNHKAIRQSPAQVDFNVPPGVYMLKIVADGKETTVRLIRE